MSNQRNRQLVLGGLLIAIGLLLCSLWFWMRRPLAPVPTPTRWNTPTPIPEHTSPPAPSSTPTATSVATAFHVATDVEIGETTNTYNYTDRGGCGADPATNPDR